MASARGGSRLLPPKSTATALDIASASASVVHRASKLEASNVAGIASRLIVSPVTWWSHARAQPGTVPSTDK
ncbi:MAG: hypothetical protein ACHREM_12455 [Polyangiales bacterium]